MQWFLVGHDFVNALSIVEPTPLKKKIESLAGTKNFARKGR